MLGGGGVGAARGVVSLRHHAIGIFPKFPKFTEFIDKKYFSL